MKTTTRCSLIKIYTLLHMQCIQPNLSVIVASPIISKRLIYSFQKQPSLKTKCRAECFFSIPRTSLQPLGCMMRLHGIFAINKVLNQCACFAMGSLHFLLYMFWDMRRWGGLIQEFDSYRKIFSLKYTPVSRKYSAPYSIFRVRLWLQGRNSGLCKQNFLYINPC